MASGININFGYPKIYFGYPEYFANYFRYPKKIFGYLKKVFLISEITILDTQNNYFGYPEK